MAISLPPTVLLSCDHSAGEGQHKSPGKQRHDELDDAVGRPETDGSHVGMMQEEITAKDAKVISENILLRREICSTGKAMARKNR